MCKKIVTVLFIGVLTLACVLGFTGCDILNGIIDGIGGGSEGSVSGNNEKVAVERIELDPTELTLKKGDSDVIYLTVYPKDATVRNVDWESSDERIVSVKDGHIQALEEGTATILVVVFSAGGIFEAYCEVTVGNGASGNGNTADLVGKTYVFEDTYYEGIDEHPYKDILISSQGSAKRQNEGSTMSFESEGKVTAYSPYLDMTMEGTYTVEKGKITVTTYTDDGDPVTGEYVIQGDTLVYKLDMGSVGPSYQELYKGVYMVMIYRLQA